MINYNLYDPVEPNDFDKTYIDVYFEKIYSKEFKFFQYNALLKKYNPKIRKYDLYVALSRNPIPNAISKPTFTTKLGQVKINLSKIWQEFKFYKFKQNFVVPFEVVEEDDNGIIYYIDV